MKTVKEVADILEMSAHTVRYYTDLGLVPSVKRDQNNNRLFDERSVNWLRGVMCLRSTGMSIKAVKNYVDLCLEGDGTIYTRRKIIEDQKKQVEQKLKETEDQFEYISNKLIWYDNIIKGEIPDTSNPGEWETTKADKSDDLSKVI